MIEIENVEIVGWEAAIRGMRNPKNSWDRVDSSFNGSNFTLGPNDKKLMTTLRNAGTDHRKFMRMITVYLDLTAPLYMLKELDTYKVGTVANSCSTMHKIHAKEFALEDFSYEHLLPTAKKNLESTIDILNGYRDQYNVGTNPEVKKEYWWQLIQLLPSSYNQKRTLMLNYEVLANMYKSRKNHKLDEWRAFCSWIGTLPYAKELIIGENHEDGNA